MKCNSTLSDEYIVEEPLWKGWTFHEFGLVLSAVFGLIALTIGCTLIFFHATHYLKPFEQRHIIRILFLIPIYSVVSFLSYYFYRHAIYFDVLEGCYEAFAISSFFTLLCHYIAPNLHDQKDYFRKLQPINWFWGVFGLQYITGGENKGPFRKPRSGLTWFNIVWIGVFQYCFIRVLFTIVAVLAQVADVYCADSLSPAFAHVWVQVFEAASVTVAMFCLIQFYLQLRDDLAEHRPFLKVLCIKLVIFFSFWQTIVISFLASANGPFQPTKVLAYPDIKVGIPSVLLCIEMAIFAVLHIFAFSWKPYSIKHSFSDPLYEPGTGLGGTDLQYRGFARAIMDAFNPWDIIKMTARGFRWLFVGYRLREQDESYQRPESVASSKLGSGGKDYIGPNHAATNAPATELSTRGRRDTVEDDRAGLLGDQGYMGAASLRMPSASPYRTVSSDDSQIDLSAPHIRPRGFAELDSKPSDYRFDDDTSYHPHMGPAAGAGRADAGGAVHPARRQEGSSWPLSDGVDESLGRGNGGYRPYRQ